MDTVIDEENRRTGEQGQAGPMQVRCRWCGKLVGSGEYPANAKPDCGCRDAQAGAEIRYKIASAKRPSSIEDNPSASDGVIGPSEEHRSVRGTALVTVRESLRTADGQVVTQAVFAAMCGHSRQFQAQIEAPGSHEILREKGEMIQSAIAHFRKEAYRGPK